MMFYLPISKVNSLKVRGRKWKHKVTESWVGETEEKLWLVADAQTACEAANGWAERQAVYHVLGGLWHCLLLSAAQEEKPSAQVQLASWGAMRGSPCYQCPPPVQTMALSQIQADMTLWQGVLCGQLSIFKNAWFRKQSEIGLVVLVLPGPIWPHTWVTWPLGLSPGWLWCHSNVDQY